MLAYEEVVRVKVDGNLTGYVEHGEKGYRYIPMGNNYNDFHLGEFFVTLKKCKASLSED